MRMMETQINAKAPMLSRHHVALHLAHRWFAFLEAPGADLGTHLTMFHPQVRLSGSRGGHLFARDHKSLKDWFASVPDAISSHHIVHSNYVTADNGDGLLSMVVAYQSPGDSGMRGSIISYETRIEFATDAARFTALDKTPILPNTRLDYETSWSTNRVLALIHAELGGITGSDGKLRAALGNNVRQVFVHVAAPEASCDYDALVTSSNVDPAEVRILHLKLTDDGNATMPSVVQIALHTRCDFAPGSQSKRGSRNGRYCNAQVKRFRACMSGTLSPGYVSSRLGAAEADETDFGGGAWGGRGGQAGAGDFTHPALGRRAANLTE